MKNKSKFLLLPASLLLLTACGTSANTSIPRGYTKVDKADATARQAFFGKVAEDIGITYAKASEGFLAEGSLSLKELSYSQQKYDGTLQYIKVTDFKADYSFGLVGYNGGLASTKAAFKLENAKFNVDVSIDGKQYPLKASDLDAAVYFDGGNLYMDFSDKDIKTFMNKAVEWWYNTNERGDKTDQIASDKEYINKYLDKYYVNGVLDADDINDVAPANGLTAKDIKFISDILNEGFNEVLANDKAKDLLTLAEDKNSKGAAISLALTSEPVEVEGAKVSGDLAASIVFDKDGVFSRFGFAGNANVEIQNSNSNYKNGIVKLNKLDFGADFKYGANVVKLPNFSDYKDFKLIK